MSLEARDILLDASELVAGDRAKQNGSAVENFTRIARLWNAHIFNKTGSPLTPMLGPEDVAFMMADVKRARSQGGIFNLDDYIDSAGYAGLAGAIAQELKGE